MSHCGSITFEMSSAVGPTINLGVGSSHYSIFSFENSILKLASNSLLLISVNSNYKHIVKLELPCMLLRGTESCIFFEINLFMTKPSSLICNSSLFEL